MTRWLLQALTAIWALTHPALAQDRAGTPEPALVAGFPDHEIRWQTLEAPRPFRIPLGPVNRWHQIADWAEVEGRVTRRFHTGTGTDHRAVYDHLRHGLTGAGFTLLAEGAAPNRQGSDTGSRRWLEAYLAANPFTAPGAVQMLATGSATQGGQAALVAYRDRAEGPVWVVVTVEQHSAEDIGTLIDLIEIDRAEHGIPPLTTEAIGRDLAEYGRVVLEGVEFADGGARLTEGSGPALATVAGYLQAQPGATLYIVGHSAAGGSLSDAEHLSQARAEAVVAALVGQHGIAPDRLRGFGAGPLAPLFSNRSAAGRLRNQRIEAVEAP